MSINVNKLFEEIQSANLPCTGVSSAEYGGDENAVTMNGYGRFDFSRALSEDELKQLEIVVMAHDPNPTSDELRKMEYQKRGVTTDEMIVALWEAYVENKPEEKDRLQSIREEVKADISVDAVADIQPAKLSK